MRIVIAADKFRGTVTAHQACAAIASAARRADHDCTEVPLADGGEGLLDVLGGPNRWTTVSGPLGDPVKAGWRFDGRSAVIEMATASGLALAGGRDGNDAVGASTRGTGQLIAAALDAGATRILVGVGGSATTDGGQGALDAIPVVRLRGVDLLVACDVRLSFLDAAEVFAPQKGASAAQVKLLRRRLDALAGALRVRYGVDVTELAHAGAGGGLAGGLASIGAELVSGFDLVAEEVGLADHVEAADLVITGEGYLDDESFDGKVVGGVCALADAVEVPVLIVVGGADPELLDGRDVLVLTDLLGERAAMDDTEGSLDAVVTSWFESRR